MKNRCRRHPVEVGMVETDWTVTVTVTAKAKMREESSSREGRKGSRR